MQGLHFLKVWLHAICQYCGLMSTSHSQAVIFLYCGGGNPGLNLGKGWQTLMNSYYLCQINKEIKGHLMPLHKKVNAYQTYTFSYYLLYLNQFLPSENNARKNV